VSADPCGVSAGGRLLGHDVLLAAAAALMCYVGTSSATGRANARTAGYGSSV
jgi:hypothetical protein